VRAVLEVNGPPPGMLLVKGRLKPSRVVLDREGCIFDGRATITAYYGRSWMTVHKTKNWRPFLVKRGWGKVPRGFKSVQASMAEPIIPIPRRLRSIHGPR
jgi:hypothetical protein